jgi:hypothetical protein
MEKNLEGLQEGDWLLGFEDGELALRLDDHLVGVEVRSVTLAQAARDLAELAEQVKTRGF